MQIDKKPVPSFLPKEEEYLDAINQKKKLLEDMKTEEEKLKRKRLE